MYDIVAVDVAVDEGDSVIAPVTQQVRESGAMQQVVRNQRSSVSVHYLHSQYLRHHNHDVVLLHRAVAAADRKYTLDHHQLSRSHLSRTMVRHYSDHHLQDKDQVRDIQRMVVRYERREYDRAATY